MSSRTAIIALVVAILLALIVYLSIRPSLSPPSPVGAVPVGDLILDLDPATISAVEIRSPDGRVQLLQRPLAAQSLEDNWTLTTGRKPPGAETGYDDTSWPVAPEHVRGLLRQLALTRALESPADSTPDPDALTLILRTSSDAQRTLRCSPRALGGRTTVFIDPWVNPDGSSVGRVRHAVVDAALTDALTNPGPLAWRDRAVLRVAPADASRIHLTNARGETVLTRLAGRWRIARPIASPAEERAVIQLLRSLETLRITDFLDDRQPTLADAGLDNPVAHILIERDRRSADTGAPAAVERSELWIGRAADPDSRTVYARSGAFPNIVTVDAAGLASLPASPHALASRLPLDTDPADAGLLMMVAANPATNEQSITRVSRKLNNWIAEDIHGVQTAVPPQAAESYESTLRFLARRPADQVSLDRPVGYDPTVMIRVESLGGAPLAELLVGRALDGSVVIQTGDLYRHYTADAIPTPIASLLALSTGSTMPTTVVDPDQTK